MILHIGMAIFELFQAICVALVNVLIHELVHLGLLDHVQHGDKEHMLILEFHYPF